MKTLPKLLVLFLLLSVFSSAKARMVSYSAGLFFATYSNNMPSSESELEMVFTQLEAHTFQYKFENNSDCKIADKDKKVLQERKILSFTKTIIIKNNPNGFHFNRNKIAHQDWPKEI